MKRQHFLRAAVAAAIATCLSGAWAQAYPSKPVTMVSAESFVACLDNSKLILALIQFHRNLIASLNCRGNLGDVPPVLHS